MAIKIFVTGGTFDKEHDPISESFVFNETHIPKLLKRSRSLLDVKVQTIMLIDSLEMTRGDQEIILKACEDAAEDKTVITHGTSNMEKTARLLGKSIKDKTIVLTGAMIPYVFSGSDALFNMGTALAFVQTLPVGVYITMNGRYYNWDNVTKNTKLGLFEEKK
ncbi:asparaginase [Patescibacteria group bacterium]|nr:asparaginase [Patescibacteria group bacterium]